MSVTTLPDPRQTYFFRNSYAPEAIHDAVNRVAEKHPGKPVVRVFDGDYRKKDAFSSQCVEMKAALESGVQQSDVFRYLEARSPIKRRDLHPDDNTPPNTIGYEEPEDSNFLDDLLWEDLPKTLTTRAVQLAKELLQTPRTTNSRSPNPHNRIQLSQEFNQSLGPLEQTDIAAPIPAETIEQKIPSVHVTQNIWHYLNKSEQEQYAQNLQDSQALGSFIIVGPDEADNIKMSHLPQLLKQHGYAPDPEINKKLIAQTKLLGLPEPESPFVYTKVEEPEAGFLQTLSKIIGTRIGFNI